MYAIKFRGKIHTVKTESEYNDLKERAKQSCECQSVCNPDDPWEYEDLSEQKDKKSA